MLRPWPVRGIELRLSVFYIQAWGFGVLVFRVEGFGVRVLGLGLRGLYA